MDYVKIKHCHTSGGLSWDNQSPNYTNKNKRDCLSAVHNKDYHNTTSRSALPSDSIYCIMIMLKQVQKRAPVCIPSR